MSQWMYEVAAVVTERLPILGISLAILVGGWLAAYVVQRSFYFVLCRTSLRARVVKLTGGDEAEAENRDVEKITARLLYYVLLSMVLVAFFSYLRIDAVTRPLLTALDGLAAAVPNLLKATVLGLGGYLLAIIVRRLIEFSLTGVGFDRRMRALGAEEEDDEKAEHSISAMLAGVGYWFVIIVAAIPVLEALKIGVLAQPLSAAFETITVYLPRIGAAIVLMIIGFVLARLARSFVEGVLRRVGVDDLMARVGLGEPGEGQSASGILGAIAMAFVLLQFAISAAGRLEIAEISQPLSLILVQIYSFLPKLLSGGLLLAVGVVIAKISGNVAGRLLAAMGFNTLMAHVGVYSDVSDEARDQEKTWRSAIEARLKSAAGQSDAPEDGLDPLLASPPTIRTASDVGGLVISALVILLFTQQVLSILQLEGLAIMLDGFMTFLPDLVVAVVLLVTGLWAGRWVNTRVDELTARSPDRFARSLGAVARIAVIVFAVMMALQQVGVGQQLITTAFGLILGAVCLALALAFGLGGRDVASRILEEEYRRLQQRDTTKS